MKRFRFLWSDDQSSQHFHWDYKSKKNTHIQTLDTFHMSSCCWLFWVNTRMIRNDEIKKTFVRHMEALLNCDRVFSKILNEWWERKWKAQRRQSSNCKMGKNSFFFIESITLDCYLTFYLLLFLSYFFSLDRWKDQSETHSREINDK